MELKHKTDEQINPVNEMKLKQTVSKLFQNRFPFHFVVRTV